jgi:glycosyltransferase involved in cell wall biosynthesis
LKERNAPKRLLVLIVTYHAERTIQDVIQRIPASLTEYNTEILVIDDSSKDLTFQEASRAQKGPFPITVLRNPVEQGYGGNQKIGLHFAIKKNFDIVALLHGDGEYAPESLPDLLQPLVDGEADAVFGSRMMRRGEALRDGMPLYRFLGNKILTKTQNLLLGTAFSDAHSGYRAYSVEALKKTPFERDTNDFHFDTEVAIQLVRAGFRIKEAPIPTYYGDELRRVNGLKYAVEVVRTTLLAKLQDTGLLYERKYDMAAGKMNPLYLPKWGFESPHTLALEQIPPASKVVDVGCASGYMARALQAKGCQITGVDQFPPAGESFLKEFIQADLNEEGFPLDAGEFHYVLLLDVIEHLRSPEAFLEALRNSRRQTEETRIVVSVPNIAFLVTRFMLLLGYFHYGSRGILDLTHTRLFTFATLRNSVEQAGYSIEEMRGVPAPFPLALGNNALARLLVRVNSALIRVSKSMFSYQVFAVARALPSLEWLLEQAHETDTAPSKEPATGG